MQAKFALVNISSSLGSNKKKWAKPNFLILKKLNWNLEVKWKFKNYAK